MRKKQREICEFAMDFFFCLQARSKNGYGFYRSSVKTGVENSIFRSEIGSGFGESGGIPLPRIFRRTPRAITPLEH